MMLLKAEKQHQKEFFFNSKQHKVDLHFWWEYINVVQYYNQIQLECTQCTAAYNLQSTMLDVKGQICRKKLVVVHLSSKQKYYLENCIKNRSQGILWRSTGQDSTLHCRCPGFIPGLETKILQVMWHGLYRQINRLINR